MGLKFCNTLSRSIEEFLPLDTRRKKVGHVLLRATVYDFATSATANICFSDLVRRYLEFQGYTSSM